jgi:hypothetical protein
MKGNDMSENLGAFREMDDEKPIKATRNDHANELADTYAQAQKLAGKNFRPSARKEWARVFRLLLRHHAYQEVQLILEWFLAHRDSLPYMPRVYSLASFAEKYASIRATWEVQPGIEISDTAQKIVTNLKDYSMPDGLDQLLPTIAERCLQRFKPYVEKIVGVKIRLKEIQEHAKVVRLIDYLGMKGMLTGKVAMSVWLEDWLKSRMRWQNFALSLLFDWHHPRWHDIHRTLTYEWCGESKRWDVLYSLLKGEKQ